MPDIDWKQPYNEPEEYGIYLVSIRGAKVCLALHTSTIRMVAGKQAGTSQSMKQKTNGKKSTFSIGLNALWLNSLTSNLKTLLRKDLFPRSFFIPKFAYF